MRLRRAANLRTSAARPRLRATLGGWLLSIAHPWAVDRVSICTGTGSFLGVATTTVPAGMSLASDGPVSLSRLLLIDAGTYSYVVGSPPICNVPTGARFDAFCTT